MDISARSGRIEKLRGDAIVLGIPQGQRRLSGFLKSVDTALGNAISDLLRSGDFRGERNELWVLPSGGRISARRVILVGLGKMRGPRLEILRQASGTAACRAQDMGLKSIITTLHKSGGGRFPLGLRAQAAVEGSVLGTYRFTRFNTEGEEKNLRKLCLWAESRSELGELHSGIEQGHVISDAANMVRDLVNLPAEEATPTFLGEKARRIAEECGISCSVFGPDEIRKMGMGGLIGVSKGSSEPPRFIVLEYMPEISEGKTLVVIGKGLTFDSGGLSLKSSQGMEDMKMDKAGGAAVLGIVQAVSKLRLPIHLVGIVPATENLPGGSAMKPGDILRTFSGKTIEVISTDAEGRLIIADALGYARKFNPDAIIDIATLTGACIIALGKVATGMLGNDRSLMGMIRKAGELSGERVWELPLWEEYDEQIKSDIADMKNVGGREAGAITAAAILKKFAQEYPWAHLDIAGTAWTDKPKPYTPKGATGVGVRLIVQFVKDWVGEMAQG